MGRSYPPHCVDTCKSSIASPTRVYYTVGKATGRKPNLSRILTFSAIVLVKVKDAGKLEPQAVEGHFVGYDKESKGYQIYYPKRHTIIVKRDIFFDKDAAVDLNVIFEGETKFLNPPVNHDAMSAPNTTNVKPKDSPVSRPHQNLLQGLPQYDPGQYG